MNAKEIYMTPQERRREWWNGVLLAVGIGCALALMLVHSLSK